MSPPALSTPNRQSSPKRASFSFAAAALLLSSLVTHSEGAPILKVSFAPEERIPQPFSANPPPNGSTTLIDFSAAGLRLVDRDAKSGLGLQAIFPVEAGRTYRQTLLRQGGPLMLYFKWLDRDKRLIPPEHAVTLQAETTDFKSADYAERAPENARYCQVWLYSSSTLTTEVVLRDWSFEDIGDAAPEPPGDSMKSIPPTAEGVLRILNLSFPGLQNVKALADKKDFSGAANELLAYYRGRNLGKSPKVDRRQKKDSLGMSLSSTETRYAEDALRHTFVGQPLYPASDRGADIDWETNPQMDNEWIWQLHRMYWWTPLGKAYWSSGDEKYAREWSAELVDWVKKNPLDGKHPKAWRTIETGQRGANFTTHFEYFIDSPSFTVETLLHLLKSVEDHGSHLIKNRGGNNWLLFESEGLVAIGCYFPELQGAKTWREEGIKRFASEIKAQVFPDGVHLELSTSYHNGCISTFHAAYRMAEVNQLAGEFPADYRATLENMVAAVMKWSLPDLTIPQFGDSWKGGPLTNFFRNWNDVFPRPEFEYLAVGRSSGKAPEETAFALSNGGFYSLRSHWGPDATFLVLKCGLDGGFHCQPDNGTFELFAQGRHFMPDSGSFIYSGDAEGRAWFRRTASHQTLTLGDADSAYAPKLILWQPGKIHDSFIVENKSYANLSHRRAVHFIQKKYFVIVDEALGEAEGDVKIHFQLLPSSAVFDEKSFSVRTDFTDGANLLVRSAAQKDLRLAKEEGQVSFIYTRKEPRPAFSFILPKSAKAKIRRFVTVILPYTGKEPEVRISAPGIDKPEEKAYSFSVSVNGETSVVGYDPLANKTEIK